MDARNTPWMGCKGQDIPEPDILRAVGMVEHCNSQHSVVLVLVLVLGWMGGAHAERPTSRAATKIFLITFPPKTVYSRAKRGALLCC